MTISEIKATLEKLEQDTRPAVGCLPEEDDEDFDVTNYDGGNFDDAVATGEGWGKESRNRSIHPVVVDLLSAIESVDRRLSSVQSYTEEGSVEEEISSLRC